MGIFEIGILHQFLLIDYTKDRLVSHDAVF